MTSDSDRKTVLVFRKDLLPHSETFITDQIGSYRRWRARLVGYRRIDGLPLPSDTLTFFGRSRIEQLKLKIAQHGQYFGYVPDGLMRFGRRINPSIIHAHFGYDAVLVYDMAKRLGVPLVITAHGSDLAYPPEVWRSGREGWFFRRYPDKLKTMFSDPSVHFIAVSEAQRRAVVERGAAPDRVHVRYTGVDRSQFEADRQSPKRRRVIIFVGRLVEMKGCEFLIRAIAEVKRSVPDARAVVVGDGPLRQSLEELASELGAPVEFMGAQPRHVVREQMAKARALALPSITHREGGFESFGMVLLEAMASGVPALTSARGGIDAIDPGVNGFSFAERDVDALTSNLISLLSDDDMFERMSAGALRTASGKFDIVRCTSEIEDLYDHILQN